MFVTLEGPDGSGKTTVKHALAEEFPNALITQEPDDTTQYGEHVRDVISDDEAPPMAVFFAFLEDHAVHIENKVKPALNQDKVVISDRYIDSRYAYQKNSLQPHLDVDALDWIRTVQESGWSLFPDLTLLLDVEAEEGNKRMNSRGSERERFESLDKQRKVRQTYLELAQEFEDRYVVIDTMPNEGETIEESKERVVNECKEEIANRMN